MATFTGTVGDDDAVNRIDATVPQLGTFTGGTLAELTDGTGDTINGLGGNDEIVAGSGADTIDGGSGNDTITGGAGADNITGGAGNDTIILNAGDAPAGETLTGGGGADRLQINGAVDITAAAVSSLATIVYNAVNGGTLTATHTQASNLTTFTGNAGTTDGLVVNLASGNTTITLSAKTLTSIESITVNGSTGNNTITGTGQADTINAGDGTDSITAGNGSDTVDGGNGTDTAIWADTRANITLERVDGFANRWIATDINIGTGDEGADNVSNVENFRFSGPVTVAVANLISLQSDGDADADSVAENA
ncbi:MAG: calcium-binding protein, partial [Aestuariivirga sp.]